MTALNTAERHWGISFKRVSSTEWRSLNGCPFCGDGGKNDRSDRFRLFLDGKPRFWCRKCGETGFLDALDKNYTPPTPQELLERRVRELEQKQREHEHRLSALEQMAHCKDHIRYHRALNEQAFEYWWTAGMTSEIIDKYLLGYCASCPTYHKSPSYTIPVINRGKLENIRHRLITPSSTGKYRPHRAGLGQSLFNADLLDQTNGRILIVEGAKKSLVLTQAGFPAIGICGKRSFNRKWLDKFAHIGAVYVALDPDATESAHRLGAMFGSKARVVDLPCKVDDMIVKHGAGREDIESFLRLARPICER